MLGRRYAAPMSSTLWARCASQQFASTPKAFFIWFSALWVQCPNSKELIVRRCAFKGLRSLRDGCAALDGCLIVVRRLGGSCCFKVDRNFHFHYSNDGPILAVKMAESISVRVWVFDVTQWNK